MYLILVSLYNDGTLKEMVKRGLVSSKHYDYLEIYIWIDAVIKDDPKIGITKAVTRASAVFNRPIVYVWRAINMLSDDNYKQYKVKKDKGITIKL